jgi:hypothetical protein
MEQNFVNDLLIFDTAVRRIGNDLNFTTATRANFHINIA